MSTIAATNLKNASSGSNNIVLNTDGTTTIAAPSNIIKSGTAVASTSGTSIDFTGLPSWVKRVTVVFDGVSVSSTSSILVQLGDSGGVENTGYSGGGTRVGSTTLAAAAFTSGFGFNNTTAASTFGGSLFISLLSGNTWTASGTIGGSSTDIMCATGGSKTLSATLDRVRITTASGTDTFDAGTINILYEG